MEVTWQEKSPELAFMRAAGCIWRGRLTDHARQPALNQSFSIPKNQHTPKNTPTHQTQSPATWVAR